jgi:DNA-binding transcriptional regulator YiaG
MSKSSGNRLPLSKPRTPTGKAVARLQAAFKMSQAQFARLLMVSPSTVGTWEKSEGPLKLRASTQKVWDTVSKLKKTEAWKRLSKQ